MSVNNAITAPGDPLDVVVTPTQPSSGLLWGTSGDDSLLGGFDDDVIYGFAGDDLLVGGLGDDVIYDGLGYDDSYGNGGKDMFVTTDEQDVSGFVNLFDGGSGVDTINYGNSSFGWEIALSISLASNGQYFDTLLDIENVIGSQQGDNIWGTDGANVLEGLGGNDTILGFGGDDTIEGGSGSDELDGGAGIDTVSYASESSSVVVNLETGAGTGISATGTDTLTNFENIVGSAFGDTLTGREDMGSTIRGRAGHDEIYGGGSGDVLYGNRGDDTIFGGNGGDTIYGGNGADVLYSGTGPNPTNIIGPFDSHNNYLYGGNNDDTLVAQSVDYTFLSGGAGDDTLVYAPAHVQSTNFVGPPIYTPDVTMAGGSDADRFILNHHGLDQIDFVITDFNEAEDTLVFDNMRRDGGVFSNPEINDIGDLDTNGDNVISSADRDWSQTASGHLVLDLEGGDTLTLRNTNSIDINAIEIL